MFEGTVQGNVANVEKETACIKGSDMILMSHKIVFFVCPIDLLTVPQTKDNWNDVKTTYFPAMESL